MLHNLNNLLISYENKLKSLIKPLENRLRQKLQNIGKRNIAIGIAIIAIAAVAIISYAIKSNANLDNHDYLFKRGYEYYSKEKYDNAIADYTAALKIKPNNPNYLYGRGGAYLQKKEYYKASADFTTALLLRSDYPDYLLQRGIAYLLMEDYARAVADFEAVLRIEPNNIEARKSIDLARRKRGSFDANLGYSEPQVADHQNHILAALDKVS